MNRDSQLVHCPLLAVDRLTQPISGGKSSPINWRLRGKSTGLWIQPVDATIHWHALRGITFLYY